MRSSLYFLILCLCIMAATIAQAKSPANHRLHTITIPTVDISSEPHRHVFVARGTTKTWHGHPSTILLPDEKTIFCAWQYRFDSTNLQGGARHGAPSGLLKRSNDGGLTWSELLDVPGDWQQVGRGSPTIHRLVDRKGNARLFIFCRDEKRSTFLRTISENDGQTWTPMQPLPLSDPAEKAIAGWTAPISILVVRGPNGQRKHVMWYERDRRGVANPGIIWQSESEDGGLTWGRSRPVVDKAGASEPAVVRSPDGRQLLMLIREQDRKLNSLFAVSDDESENWSVPKQLPLALTGDRHLPRYAPDGRLVIVFRPVLPQRDKWPGVKDYHYFRAWVGRYDDIVEGSEGGYLVNLLKSHAGIDHTYPGLELLPDGTFVGTTYIKYRPDANLHSIVSVRFKLSETDERVSPTK